MIIYGSPSIMSALHPQMLPTKLHLKPTIFHRFQMRPDTPGPRALLHALRAIRFALFFKLKNMRSILHCDINNCFASIESAINPNLKGLPIAVCGNPKERRGIVLAKSEEAKKHGVKTGDPIWQARQKCPQLLCIPPHYDAYAQYSDAIQKYYLQFTPLVEPYGLDECWLDVSHHPNPLRLAGQIRTDIRRIFQITVSIGLSFNKVFAKLGSDLKKPDAISHIPYNTFTHITWGLPVSSLLGAGRATTETLATFGIKTIGQLAKSNRSFIKSKLGKHGDRLWQFANGMDESPVLPYGHQDTRQSISHGTTLPQDAHTPNELWPTLQSLAQNIGFTLQQEHLNGQNIAITIRDAALQFKQYQTEISIPTAACTRIASYAYMLLTQNYPWHTPIRAITIKVSHLTQETNPIQLPLFPGQSDTLPQDHLDQTLQAIQTRYGPNILCRGYQFKRPTPSRNTFPHPHPGSCKNA